MARMSPDDPRVQAVAQAIVALIGSSVDSTPDELVAHPFGLEDATATMLRKTGQLTCAKLGRCWYARRSAVLALVDKFATRAAEQEAKPSVVTLTDLAQRERAPRARRSA